MWFLVFGLMGLAWACRGLILPLLGLYVVIFIGGLLWNFGVYIEDRIETGYAVIETGYERAESIVTNAYHNVLYSIIPYQPVFEKPLPMRLLDENYREIEPGCHQTKTPTTESTMCWTPAKSQ